MLIKLVGSEQVKKRNTTILQIPDQIVLAAKG